jgi:PAS domain S-box-containing protein
VRNNAATWSDETYKLFEIDKSELNEHRKNFLNLVVPEDRIKVDQALSDALDGVKKYDIEYRICLAGGREKVIHALGEITRDTEGKAVAMHGTVQDITERKRAELQLHFTQFAMEHASFEIYWLDKDARVCYVNQKACQTLGYTREELQKLSVPDLDPLFPADQWALHWETLKQDKSQFFETQHRCKDGRIMPVEVSANYVKFGEYEYNVAYSHDITERKQAEMKLCDASKKIEDLYNYAPCGYHSLDKDGIIIRVNDTELAWLGCTRDEVVGKMKLVDFFAPAGRKNFHETFSQLQKQGFIHDVEVEIIRKDGTVFTGLINATAIYGPSGNFVMSRSTMADITVRKRMEQKLHDLNAHLQSVREEEKTSIARELHDDMGGTLTALNMKTYLLKAELLAHQETAAFLGHIGVMLQLIDGAMGIMRGIITGLRPTILDDLGIQAALEWQAAQFQKLNGIECRVNCIYSTGEGGVKQLDKLRSIALFRIAQEALTNAAKHSGASRVEIEFLNNGEEIVMSIIDNGCGMTKNRTDSSIPYGILGMRERVEQLGGMIGFDTPPGGGFSVTVILLLPANE